MGELSYNWHFEVIDQKDQKEASKIFCVADFVGDLCKALASRIRGAVSSVTFDDFHKNSAKIIQVAVFGIDKDSQNPKEEIKFEANNLVVTSVDIRAVEPVDQRTRDSLQKSVTLAIEITTQSQEAAARREAERIEQEAKGKLERQRILDDAEAAKIEAEAAVQAAKLKAEALKIETESELERLNAARAADIRFAIENNNLEVEKAEKMAKIETDKFNQMVASLGKETIQAMANGPQEHQVKMLQSLGLSSTLITDGRTPINLLNTAGGLLGNINQTSLSE